MRSSTKYLKILFNYLFAILVAALILFVLPRALSFFWPFVTAAVIAAIANPLVRFLEKKMNIKRRAGSVFVIVLTLAAVGAACYGILYLLVTQVIGFFTSAPDMWARVNGAIRNLSQEMSHRYALLPKGTKDFFENVGESIYDSLSDIGSSIGERAAQSAGNGVKNAPTVLVGIIMCVLASYLFVAERESIGRFAGRIMPRHVRERFTIVTGTMKSAVGGYFKAQFKIMAVVYIVLLIGFLVLGIDYAFLIALLIAFLDFLPFFGTGAVMWPWALYAFIQKDYKFAVGMMVVWGLSQLVRQLIQPKLVGDSIGMPAIPTLVLLYVGFRVRGALGLILAVPIGMIVYNLYRAGLFSNFIISTRMLFNDFRRMRIFTKEEIEAEGIDVTETGFAQAQTADSGKITERDRQ
ncbi:MAG: sporulation integral membrane protein YtvI [Lachnospiraceae bacterium]|nr:sporulation integral membrane protein YtvI [Lachnospiraceae bacterium]